MKEPGEAIAQFLRQHTAVPGGLTVLVDQVPLTGQSNLQPPTFVLTPAGGRPALGTSRLLEARYDTRTIAVDYQTAFWYDYRVFYALQDSFGFNLEGVTVYAVCPEAGPVVSRNAQNKSWHQIWRSWLVSFHHDFP